MTDIETALKNYLDNLAVAATNLDDVPRSVRAGRESQKRDAQAAIPDLKKRYADALKRAAFGIAVLGSGTEKFVELARAEADVLVVDSLVLYRRIASRVSDAMGTGREFGVSHYGAVISELRAIAEELDITSLPSPKWTEPVSVSDEQGLFNHVRNMVDSGVGLDFAVLYISQQILDSALAAEADKNTVPVLVTGLGEKATLVSKLFHEGRNAVVQTTDEVTRDFVLETFNKVKKHIKTAKKS